MCAAGIQLTPQGHGLSARARHNRSFMHVSMTLVSTLALARFPYFRLATHQLKERAECVVA